MTGSSDYHFETLRRGGQFTLYRGRRAQGDSVLGLAINADPPSQQGWDCLLHEYALAGELHRAWAARPFKLVQDVDRPMLLFEDLGFEPLDLLLARTPGQRFDLARFLALAIQLAWALGQVHRQRLIHKDVKPAHVLVGASGQLRLTGFGIAARTLAYMSPEQTGRMNRAIDARSDLYSLGVTLYELLTGTLPLTATDPVEWVHCHIARVPPDPGRRVAGIPPAVSSIILKLLSKNPEDRYQTANGVEADLRTCLNAWDNEGGTNQVEKAAGLVRNRMRTSRALRRFKSQGLLAADARLTAEASHPGSAKDFAQTNVADLDLTTLDQASQLLSSETAAPPLVAKLMRLTIEHAGAERGLLILLHDADAVIEAAATAQNSGVAVTLPKRPVGPNDLPLSALWLVLRTRTRLVLDDASREGVDSSDGYMDCHRPRSMLLLPVFRQTQVLGVLYLENTVAASAFAVDRLAVLTILASQAATSLEEARIGPHSRRSESEPNEAKHPGSEQTLGRVNSELAHQDRATSLSVLRDSIAHELSQPLTGIVTYSSACMRMLGTTPPNIEGAQETARRLVRDADRAAEGLARLRALFAERHATRESVDLNEAATQVIAVLEGELARNHVILETDLASPSPNVWIDRVQLQQVILNLIRNASEAMSTVHERPRHLQIRTRVDANRRALMSVQDSGVGLEPQAAGRLFEAFYTTKADGIGIGLNVCRTIVESHGGRLSASANEGPGATFSFFLPGESDDPYEG
jgi:signal transduction histidine kinase